jgi:hypothetical protein
MDLGFGSANQVVGTQLANAALQAAKVQEAAISSEISKYDSIINDATDTELEQLRNKRLAAMKAASIQKSNWLAAGHGVYTQDIAESGQNSADVAKVFFDVSAKSERLVVHFHRSSTRCCDAYHRALTQLAPKHVETRFVGINVEGCDDIRGGGSGAGAKFLVERLGITVMPTLLLVKDRQAIHHIRGFDELGPRGEEFSLSDLAFVLGTYDVLTRQEDEMSLGGGGRGGGGGVGSMGGSNAMGEGGGPSMSTLRMFGLGGSGGGVRSGGYEDFDSDED